MTTGPRRAAYNRLRPGSPSRGFPCPRPLRRRAPDQLVLPGRFRAAVFDMDGLLLDTEPLWHDAERELLDRHGDTLHRRRHGGVARPRARDIALLYARAPGPRREAIEVEIGEIMLAHYVAGRRSAPVRLSW